MLFCLLGYSCRSNCPDSDAPIFVQFRLLKCHFMTIFVFSYLIYLLFCYILGENRFWEIQLLRTIQAAGPPPPNAHRKVNMDEASFVNSCW